MMPTEKDRVTDDLQRFIKKNQWNKAIQTLDRLSGMEPNNAAHRLRSGDYYLKLGETQKAVTAYHQAAELFIQGGFVVKALAAYKLVLRSDPQNTAAHLKMQGLHGRALQQTAHSQTTGASAEPSPAATAARVAPSVEIPASATVASREEETEELDEGLIGIQLERTAYGEVEPPAPAPPSSRTRNVIPLFSSLRAEEFSEVVERMIPRHYPSGSRIVNEGEMGDSIYLISQGSVRVSTRIGEREIVLSDLNDNDFFGEVAFLTGRPRTASVLTRSDTEILELRGEDLREIIRKYPRVREVLDEFYRARVKDALSKVKRTEP